MALDKAKVFWSGPSQAVRLPKAYRFEVEEVTIRKVGNAVILEPVNKRAWPEGYVASFAGITEDFERPDPLPESPHRDASLGDPDAPFEADPRTK
jgi:antitoxin VapB